MRNALFLLACLLLCSNLESIAAKSNGQLTSNEKATKAKPPLPAALGGASSSDSSSSSSTGTATTTKPMLVANPCDTDVDCNAPHGKCVASTTSSLKLCMCSSPWYGPDCTKVEKQAACDPPCQNGGECTMTQSKEGNKGVCVCQTGFVGATCEGSGCPNKCNGQGICKVTTDKDGKASGKCYCNPGFAGRACSRKVCPYTERGECDGAGRCIRGDCKCRIGFFGRACTKRNCVSKCSGHGVCVNSTFACQCDPGFVGLNCERVVCPKTKEGTCSNHGTCNHETGKCTCDAEYAGESCGHKKCNGGKVGCSGHGRCEEAKCVCDVGYVGVACESHGCPMNCLHQAGHGECFNGECQCFPGYDGKGCGEKMIVPQPCGDSCQVHCTSADAHTCEVAAPSLSARAPAVATGGKFPGAKCYQKCLWNCVRACFSQLSPAAARAEAEHWNTTVSELGMWRKDAMKQYSALEAKYVAGQDEGEEGQGAKIDSDALEKKVEKLRNIMEYVDALKTAAGKEQRRSSKLAEVGNQAESAVKV